jgi:hypothetical protein
MTIEANNILDKIDRLADEGIIEFNVHEGKVYRGTEHIPRSKPLTVQEVDKMYSDALGKMATKHVDYVDPRVLIETLIELVKKEEETVRNNAIATGSLFSSTTQFVNYWLDKLGMEIKDNDLIYVNPQYIVGTSGADNSIGKALLVNFLKIKLSEYNHNSEDKDLPKEDINFVLEVAMYARKKLKLAKLRDNMKYDKTTAPYSHSDLMEWAKGLLSVYFITHGENNTVRDEDAIIFLHMLWQIKRKIYSLPISSELIYSFYSLQQNMGKTMLVQGLAKPFAWAYTQAQVNEILDPDDRIARCREKFVVDMIELAKVQDRGDNVNAVASLFKSLVSNTNGGEVATHALRGFHTQSVLVEEQTTVFVTTTNIKIASVIQDRDMRRYWEFVLDPKKGYDPAFFWAANPYIDDVMQVYLSIDENCAYGYYHTSHPTLKHYYEQCRVIQKDMAKTNALSEWMTLQGITVSDDESDGHIKMSIKTFTQKFSRYKAQEGSDSKAFNAFYVTSILTNVFGIDPEIEMVNGMATKFIYVKGNLR